MLVGGNAGGVVPILKRSRTHSICSEEPMPKKASNDPTIEELCDLVLQRLRATGLGSSYANCLETMKEAESKTQVVWLQHLRARVAVMDKAVSEFVLQCIKLPWKVSELDALCDEYYKFMVSLATAHSDYYCKPILKALFSLLIPDVREDAVLRVSPHTMTEAKRRVAQVAINTIVAIHTKVPLSEALILIYAHRHMPYFKKHPHVLVIYIKSLLIIANRAPSMRKRILETIVHIVLTIDVNIPRSKLPEEEESEDEQEEESEDEQEEESEDEQEEVFPMEVGEPETEASKVQKFQKKVEETEASKVQKRLEWIFKYPVAQSLDVLMDTLMLYVHCLVHDQPFSLDYTKDLTNLHAIGCMPGSVKFVPQCSTSNKEDAEMEDDTQEESTKLPLSQGCACGGSLHALAALKLLYVDLRDTFVKVVLPTHSSGHVQFILFYLLSLRPGLTSIFLEFLRTRYFLDPSAPVDVRKNAMAYIGSLLVRGKFVPFSLVQSCIEVIVNWCHSYIKTQEVLTTRNFKSLTHHPVFYCACQSVFYVFSFRYKEFTRNKKSLDFARNLNLEHLVCSKLNPLAVCSASTVQNFAAITQHVNLFYCYTIMESNKRSKLPFTNDVLAGNCAAASITGTALDMFFPYEPYLLQSSARYVEQHFQYFEELPPKIAAGTEQANTSTEPEMEEDDFLDQSASNTNISNYLEFQFSPDTRRNKRELY